MLTAFLLDSVLPATRQNGFFNRQTGGRGDSLLKPSAKAKAPCPYNIFCISCHFHNDMAHFSLVFFL